jgi:hypothetical protein
MHKPGCTRVENGTMMTGRGRGGRGTPGAAPDGRGTQAALSPAPAGGDCTSNLEQINISLVAARRYSLVDEEAGVVLGMVVLMAETPDDDAAKPPDRVVLHRRQQDPHHLRGHVLSASRGARSKLAAV